MKNLQLILIIAILPIAFVSAQERKTIHVKGGTRIIDYFPDNERYIYPEFSKGVIRFSDGTYYLSNLNYDILNGEIVFIQGKDTLAINRKDIDRVESELDTFYYDNGFLRILDNHYPFLLLAKQFVKLTNVSKEGAYGTSNSTSSVTAYKSVNNNGGNTLIENSDLTLSVIKDYYIGNKVIGFALYKPKNVVKLYPELKKQIEEYLENNQVDFRKYEDLVKFTAVLYKIKTTQP